MSAIPLLGAGGLLLHNHQWDSSGLNVDLGYARQAGLGATSQGTRQGTEKCSLGSWGL